jgi:protein arginine kinase activator
MQCQCCKNHTATIHLTEISNGQRLETHLCESCAQKQGLAVKSQIPLNELLSTLLAVQPDLKKQLGETEGSAVDTPCPSCGMTLRRFQKEVVLGCPYDYEFFEKSLNPIIEKSQGGNTTHCGKVPSKLPSDSKKQIDIVNLKKNLESAVKNENYETAAKLRDRIKKLQ